MADLTQAQLTFVQSFFNYDAKKYFQKKKLKAQVQEFFRRRDKAQTEINDLPPDHPQLDTLKKALAAATKKAEGGDMKGAYNDLKATKETARAQAKIARDGASIGAIDSDLRVLETLIRRFVAEQIAIRQRADTRTQDMIDQAALLRDPQSAHERDDMLKVISENYRDKAQLLAEWDRMADNIKQDMDSYKALFTMAPTVPDLLGTISHNITLLNAKDPTAAQMPHNARYTAADQSVRTYHLLGRGMELQADVDRIQTQRRQALLDLLATKTDHSGLPRSMYTDDDGKPLEGKAAEDAAQKMAEQFAIAEEREAERLEAARKAYAAESRGDTFWLGITEDESAITDTRTLPFDTAELMDDADIDVTDTKKRPDELAAAAASALDSFFDDKLTGDTVPDEIFEMCTRSVRDWYVEAAKSAGIAFDPDNPETIDPTVWAKIKAVGLAMQAKANEKYPHRVKMDAESRPTEVTIGGVTYGNVQHLGEGGGGEVFTATDPVTGHKIVLKAPLNFSDESGLIEDDWQSLRSEAASHREVSGGELGPCPKNVLDMKAMVMTPNGVPLIAMDLADAGDAKGYTNAMSACENSGLISEPARQAMMAAQMKDIMLGMKAMQSKGMTHHDLKEANVFLASDGTFKVADFGLGRHVDKHDSAVPDMEEFTPGYQPPELLSDEDVTQKSDNFTLGEILQRISDPIHKTGKVKKDWATDNPVPSQQIGVDNKPVMVSALDKIINRLKDPDPDKRPTIDAVLMSSYFVDQEDSHTREDLDRLKKASAEYAKTVGRETGRLNQNLNVIQGAIVQLEKSRSDQLDREWIDHRQRYIAERKAVLNKKQQQHDAETDDKKKKQQKFSLVVMQGSIDTAEQEVAELTKKLGVKKTLLELEEIDNKVADLRKQVVAITKQIADIHAKDDYKDVIAELNDANKAFT